MRISGTFKTKDFKPGALAPSPDIQTGLPTGVATMEKQFSGPIEGRSATLFTAAFDPKSGLGAYCAMESFEGSLNGKRGAFNFIHSAATSEKTEPKSSSRSLKAAEQRISGPSRAAAACGSTLTAPTIWFDVDGLS